MTAYPDDLHLLKTSGLSVRQHDNVRRTQFESGRITQSKLLTKTRYTATATAWVVDADLADFQTWAKSDALVWFDWDGLFRDADGNGITQRMRIVGESVRYSKADGGYRVSMSFEYYD